jgi:hypothetical protein
MKLDRRAAAVLAVAVMLLAAACARRAKTIVVANRPPEISLKSSSLPPARAGEVSRLMRWTASDPEGRIDHYLYAVDPRAMDRADDGWTRTDETSYVMSVPAHDAATLPSGRSGHLFAVRAVDAGGALSAPAWVAFGDSSATIPPTVQILCPRPSDLARAYLPPSFRINWDGIDPDGVFTQKPVKYKYRLFTDNGPDFNLSTIRARPDSVRRFYAPQFADWDSVGGDSTSVSYSNLTIDAEYIFVVVAFDEAGAYSPVFSFSTNMLYFRVIQPNSLGPPLTMFGSGFSYTYATGSIPPNPAPALTVDEPADQPLTFSWFAMPFPSSCDGLLRYRWALDIADIGDETPRSNEATDWMHWSQWSDAATSATVGPFNPPGFKRQSHQFYIEADDPVGLRSLGTFGFRVSRAPFDDDLLIVDDTRYLPDQRTFPTPCMNAPIGAWPTAAELDTFLYARGAFPWRCYPAGTMSTPGIFNGYHYDTLGTRGLPGVVPSLLVLNRYRHVLWLVNNAAASNFKAPTDPTDPTTAMRYMSEPGRINVLAAYVAQGGQLWLAGAGAGSANLRPWNKTNNDAVPPTLALTFSNANGELVPGRFIYDVSHWRSEFKQLRATVQINRSLGRLTGSPGLYSLLPPKMETKSVATDPLPPLRTSSNFYQTQSDIEFLSLPNIIMEGGGAVLDTLYAAAGGTLPFGQIAANMTYYHGSENAPLVFTGFNLWNFRRAECIQLVDFVLQQVWGLSRDPDPRLAQPVTRR